MFGKLPGIFAFWLLQIGNSVIIPSVDLMCITHFGPFGRGKDEQKDDEGQTFQNKWEELFGKMGNTMENLYSQRAADRAWIVQQNQAFFDSVYHRMTSIIMERLKEETANSMTQLNIDVSCLENMEKSDLVSLKQTIENELNKPEPSTISIVQKVGNILKKP